MCGKIAKFAKIVLSKRPNELKGKEAIVKSKTFYTAKIRYSMNKMKTAFLNFLKFSIVFE